MVESRVKGAPQTSRRLIYTRFAACCMMSTSSEYSLDRATGTGRLLLYDHTTPDCSPWPDGIGKTRLGVALAQHLNGEIISADSRPGYLKV